MIPLSAHCPSTITRLTHTMARTSQPDSIGSLIPISTYSTRSALRKSLNVETDTTSEQLSTDTSTLSTPSIDRSTDLQNSPASSRTSSNIVDSSYTNISPADSTTMPPKAKPAKSQRTRATSTPDSFIQTTETKSDRPGRARKPTQKAAELAADGNSKLFKSIAERQPSKEIEDGDDESSSEEADSLAIDENDGDEGEASSTPKKSASGSVKQHAASKSVILSPTRVISARTGNRTPCASLPAGWKKRRRATELEDQEEPAPKKAKSARPRVPRSQSQTPALETAEITPVSAPTVKTVRPSRKRKHTEEPDDIQEAPAKKTKTANTQIDRAESKIPVVETPSTVARPAPAPASTTKSSKKRKIKVEPKTEEVPVSQSSATELPLATRPIRTIRKRKDNTKTTTEETTEDTPAQPNPSKITRSSTKPISPNPNSTTTTTSQQPKQPTRLKLTLKPPTPTFTTAQKGQTGLPCGLSCLKNEQLFYMWAVIAIEHEELADEVGAWPGFDHDRSVEVWPLRKRWNEVLERFCECGVRKGDVVNTAASNGGRSGSGARRRTKG